MRLFFDNYFHPVIETANHDGADRPHRCDFLAFLLTPLQTSLYGFGNGDALRQGETNGRVDTDAAIGGFLNSRNSCTRDRDLYDHIGRQPTEFFGLLDDGFGIAIKARIGLDG